MSRICAVVVLVAQLVFAQSTPQHTEPYQMLQDQRGFIWVATSRGLERRDAHESKLFTSADGLPSDHVQAVAEDRNGVIWAGTNGGLANLEGGRFHRRWKGLAAFLTTARGGELFFTDFSCKCMVVAERTGEQLVFHPFSRLQPVTGAVEDSFGNFWYLTNHSLESISRQEVERGMAGSAATIEPRVWIRMPVSNPAIQIDDQNRVLYGNESQIFLFDPKTGTTHEPQLVGGPAEWRSWRFRLFERVPSGRIWIPTYANSMYFQNNLLRMVQPPFDGLALLMDREGTLWNGGTGKRSAVDEWGPRSAGVPAEAIFSIRRLANGTLIATGVQRVYSMRTAESEWTPVALAPGMVEKRSVFLSTVPKGDGYVLPGVGRLYWLDYHNRVREEYPMTSPTDLPVRTLKLSAATDGTIWVASNVGLYKVTADGRGAKRIELPGDNGRMRALSVTQSGDAVAGYSSGVAVVRDNRVVRHFNKASGLLEDAVQGLDARDGEIWLGYDNVRAWSRVQWKDDKAPTIRHFTQDAGYAAPGTVWLYRDKRGWIWRGGDGFRVSDGVHVEPEDWVELDTSRFEQPDVVQNAVFEDHDGSMWFGSGRGVLHYLPPTDLFERCKRPTPIAITAVGWDGQPAGEFGLAPSSLEAGNHSVYVKFASLSFVRPKEVRYKYRLWPHEKEWKTTQEHEIRYVNLPAGSYRFEVMAKGLNLAWTDKPATYQFDLIAPWYSSMWFLSGSSLAGLGVIVYAQRRWAARHARTMAAKAELAKVKELFVRVIDLNEDERRTALQHEDAALAAKVEQMLEGRGGLLDEPVWRVAKPDPRKDLDGVVLGERYEVTRWLASGGFANVYLAKDQKLGGRLTAVKVPHAQPEDPAWVEKRLRQEIEALGRIRHPNVVTVVDLGQTPDGRTFVAMEYVEGATLRSVLGKGALPPSRVARLMRQFGRGIAAAHAQGVVHRDLKPENLMLRNPGSDDEQMVIIDFGIAVVKTASDPTTGVSKPAGSLDYMAPELLIGSALAASDVYSMGLILYEMLTGERASSVRQRGGDFANELLSRNPDTPTAVAAMIGDVLHYQPEHRRWSAIDFADAVAKALS